LYLCANELRIINVKFSRMTEMLSIFAPQNGKRKIMLLRFKVKNFLSFSDEVEFDMFPNIKRERFMHHVYTDLETPLLKQAAIYGANGSGKSNFIKAMAFVREFITRDNYLKSVNMDALFFQLSSTTVEEMMFEIEFYVKERYYIYCIGISRNSIEERLLLSGIGKRADTLIYERNGSEITSPYLQNESSTRHLLEMNPLVSLLHLNSRFPVLTGTDASRAYEWFTHHLEIIVISSTIPWLITMMSEQPKLLTFANEVFENTGIGIKRLEINDMSFDKWISDNKNAEQIEQLMLSEQPAFMTSFENNRNIADVSMENGKRRVREFLFEQAGQAGFARKMKIGSQSDGTVRLLTLIPAMFAAMHQQKTVFIDEIDNCIHPNLMFELLRFYADNKSNGQLVFTTHTTQLLNQQLLVRPDEIWFTEKSDGSTRMYSLNDFRLHNTISIENGYLDGRYGAVPEIGELKAG